MKSKIVQCVDCGKEFPRKLLNRKMRCHDCAIAAMVTSARQLSAREGPYFDRWLKSRKWTKEQIEAAAEKMKQRYIEGCMWRLEREGQTDNVTS